MGAKTDIRTHAGVAHIVLDAGPASRLSLACLNALKTALPPLCDDDAVDYIALSGKGHAFPSGITTPCGGGDDHDNQLADICLMLELCPKPVIAVLTGAVIGGGAELALAAHYRIAHRTARFGFPHARLGLVPNAGATQRLPRLVGAQATLDLLLHGKLESLSSDAMKPLIDMGFDDTVDDAINRFAHTLRSKKAGLRATADRRDGFADTQGFQTAIAKARADVETSGEFAHKQILSAVEASIMLPIDAGLAFEDAAAEDCAETSEAKALAHLFRVEQSVSAQTRRVGPLPSDSIAVLGGGPLAAQIVATALVSGLKINWSIKDKALQRESAELVQKVLQDILSQGHLSRQQAQHCKTALQIGNGPEMLEGVTMALRAARGQRNLPIPQGLTVAHCLPGPDPSLALNFVQPVETAPLVEVVLGPDHTDRDAELALALARRLNKMAVVETTSADSVSERLKHTLWRAADALVDLGQSPFVIDDALRKWGMTQPPYERADAYGLSVIARQARASGCTNWSALVLDTGRAGRAANRGFYKYDQTGTATPDADILCHIETRRAAQKDLSPDQIQRLIIGAMSNAGAKLLRDQVVPRAGDIDVVSVFTRLIPRTRGGILHAVGAMGLLQTLHAMDALQHSDTDLWSPDPMFRELIKYGRSFDAL
ncbi:enoyl-CoA hydratase-related protein [Marivita sp. S0852]|uniref:enoyl-CoA hydratase-related protein n=1 Tax=Marivita sp. S0852 TaxID=3373893 RepID=UPI0039826AC9